MNESSSFGRTIVKYAVLNVVANCAAVLGIYAALAAIGIYLEKKNPNE